MKYQIEISEKEHKIVIANTNADLTELIAEFYRAISKIYRTINAEFLIEQSTESIKKAYER